MTQAVAELKKQKPTKKGKVADSRVFSAKPSMGKAATKTCDEHCQHTLKLYGLTGKDIHEWMDSPVQIAGFNHRKFRHNIEKDLPTAHLVFDKKYGPRMVENIFLDHLIADMPKKNTTSENRSMKQSQ